MVDTPRRGSWTSTIKDFKAPLPYCGIRGCQVVPNHVHLKGTR